jgi:hypothetical protein
MRTPRTRAGRGDGDATRAGPRPNVRVMSTSRASLVLAAPLLALFVACGGTSGDGVPAASSGAPATASGDPSSPTAPTATSSAPTASPTGTASPASTLDGAPTRTACTSSFGSALTSEHGRLDGTIAAIVPASTHACNGDSTHVHLQVKVDGAVYDVAVNADGLEAEADAPLPGSPWSEGWHAGDQLDYVNDLGLHASSFTLTGLTAVRQRIEAELASANHVAIYATGYGPTGVHLVHRQGSGRDGAIVLDPLGPKPHILAFRFDTQTF